MKIRIEPSRAYNKLYSHYIFVNKYFFNLKYEYVITVWKKYTVIDNIYNIFCYFTTYFCIVFRLCIKFQNTFFKM